MDIWMDYKLTHRNILFIRIDDLWKDYRILKLPIEIQTVQLHNLSQVSWVLGPVDELGCPMVITALHLKRFQGDTRSEGGFGHLCIIFETNVDGFNHQLGIFEAVPEQSLEVALIFFLLLIGREFFHHLGDVIGEKGFEGAFLDGKPACIVKDPVLSLLTLEN